ncbi:Tn7 transposase TnsA N-terminal domain-containing protein [Pseudoalteromonas tetraodonis]|jgi:hypothetical protein|uniref:Tn7 transposase TnsA N-terminal domain-containing protein n=1 Tax=Pseudoalteromonas tetraodonis TaxID=43659 RepID=UPI003CFF7062
MKLTVTKTNANVHRGRFVLRFNSQKNKSVLTPESFQELKKAYLLECDPNVVMFTCQPEQIAVTIDKKTRRYTPDFLVLYRSGFSEYIEIHHASKVDDAYRAKIAFFDKFTRKKAKIGIRLIVVDKLNSIEMANLSLLTQYYAAPTFPLSMAPDGQLTFAELIQSLEAIAVCPISEAYGLIAAKVYHLNLSKPLTGTTVLTRAYR